MSPTNVERDVDHFVPLSAAVRTLGGDVPVRALLVLGDVSEDQALQLMRYGAQGDVDSTELRFEIKSNGSR